MKKVIKLTESDLTRIIQKVITESKKKPSKSEINYNIDGEEDNTKGYTKFMDIQPGEYFLRFGTNGQLWQKISDTESKFIKNVGKKTASKGTDVYKQPRIFSWPSTMEVTRVNK